MLDSNVDEYFPLKRRNSPYTYKIKISGLKKYFTEEQYTVNLWTADENFRACGESREFTFYKVAESIDSVGYVSRRNRDGQYLFFAEKEMPSYDWYHVLKVCDKRQYLIGEIKE
ncbi:hypothetical protein AGMMS49938_12690 [Fibrobacterales bacterium]|nr:hypothetical protein AGMMS49938_12690 [Fibrobacterales bacterium]